MQLVGFSTGVIRLGQRIGAAIATSWILATGSWNDNGVWDDASIWMDG